jgi:hypothetical protein
LVSTPLSNEIIVPNIWKNKIHVPNHQPEYIQSLVMAMFIMLIVRMSFEPTGIEGVSGFSPTKPLEIGTGSATLWRCFFPTSGTSLKLWGNCACYLGLTWRFP